MQAPSSAHLINDKSFYFFRWLFLFMVIKKIGERRTIPSSLSLACLFVFVYGSAECADSRDY